jgi:hypothetical protein
MTSEAPLPWEQQAREGKEAFYCFTVYRDTGPLERSYARVVSECGRSRTLIQRWMTTWFWIERCRAWDKHQDEIRQRKHTEATLLMSERQASQAQGYQEALFAPVLELLRRMASPVTREEVLNLPTADLMQLTLVAARLFPAVARSEREARGAPIPDLSAVWDADEAAPIEEPDAIEEYDWYRSMAAALELAGIEPRQLPPGNPEDEEK